MNSSGDRLPHRQPNRNFVFSRVMQISLVLHSPHVLAFHLFGFGHLAALTLMILVPLALVLVARMVRSERIPHSSSTAFALLLSSNKILELAIALRTNGVRWQDALPMQLCDWAAFAAIIALLSRRQIAYELAYLWGLSGTLQAIITPDLAADFSQADAWMFFTGHCGIVSAIIFLTFAFRLRLTPPSIARVFAWSQIYLAVALAVNLLLDTNYGYLLTKPIHPSLLDYLGPWPLYILSLEALALISFVIYYSPFFIADKMRMRKF